MQVKVCLYSNCGNEAPCTQTDSCGVKVSTGHQGVSVSAELSWHLTLVGGMTCRFVVIGVTRGAFARSVQCFSTHSSFQWMLTLSHPVQRRWTRLLHSQHFTGKEGLAPGSLHTGSGHQTP